MKLSTVLVLCCVFFTSRASPVPTEDADCDDPEVFEAVEIALREYNGEKKDGNQFALYMVMEAKKTAGPGKQFFVKYQIRESSCAVGGDKLWQDCDYRASAEAESGECTAQVYVDKTENISNVTQECKIISVEGKVTLSRAECLGCYHPIPGDSLQLLPIVRYAIRIFNNKSDHSSLYEVGEIIKATRQVVAGLNYAFQYEIKETNCSKDYFPELRPECKPIPGGHRGRCEAKAYVDLSNTIADVAQKCQFIVDETVPPRITVCRGCPKPIPADSVELEEPLSASVEKYNEESNDDFYYKAEEISSATVQVVAGKNYNITFKMRKTNCSKTDVKEQSEYCEATADGDVLVCRAQVYVVPWTKEVRPTVNCVKENGMVDLFRRPPGFTPFRSLAVEAIAQNAPHKETEEGPKDGQAPGKGPGKESRCDPAYEQGDGHDTQCEPGHRHGHGHTHRHDTVCGQEHEQRRGQGHEGEQGRGHGHGHGHGHDRRCRPKHEHGDKPGHGHGKHKDKQK
uniref:Kininogen 1 n=1 Tax=Pelodiscus sinensis TaxID=13735 RepID=K7GH45_PELSI